MSKDRKCIVKGKSRKYLCGVDEPTRKVLVSYKTRQNANSALKRMYLLHSDYVAGLYDGNHPCLEIVEIPEQL